MFNHLRKLFLLATMIVVPWVTEAQTHYTLTVGTPTATSRYVPTNAYYNYSFAQFIYHANEVGIDGVIDTLKFHVDHDSLTRTWTIYMAETSHSTFSGGSDAVASSYFQQVYSGSVNCSPGWVTIALDSTFTYQDSTDLVICVIDQTGSYNSPYPYFSGQEMTGGYRSIYTYQDGSPYSLASPPSCSSTSFLPMIQLGITSTSYYCAQPSNVAVSGISHDQATIAWHENGAATAWEVVVSDTAVTDFSAVSTLYSTDTTYTVDSLAPNTLYYVYVRAACTSTDFSGWSSAVTFTSACMGSQTLPYSTGFENLATGELPNCWQQIAAGSSSAATFPSAYAYASNARNSNVYFEFESSNGQTEIAALPTMDDINQLVLSFYASVMDVNFTLEVGVMEDTTFVPVDTVRLTAGSGGNWAGSYYPYSVYFNSYTGMGDRIAMRVTAAGSYTLMMDDLTVDYAPTCPAPTYLTATANSVDWITLSWTENGNATSWTIEYDTVPIADSLLGMNIANTVSATSTTETLTNLDTATTYYIYVYADCGSEACSTVASTLSALPAEMPYSCNFEQSGNNGWELLNGDQANQWHVGSATSNGGLRSLYISNDNGSNNTYSTGNTSYTYAIRTLNIADTGAYAYSYDWKCQGESHYYDFCRAFLAPASYTWTAGVNPASSTYNFSSWGIPAGWVELTDDFASPRTMSLSNSWRTVSGEIIINTPGTYNLVFAWANDGGGGSQPPMAVDNVYFLQLSCPSPQNLTATYVANDTVVLGWQPGGSETSWLVTNGDSFSDVVYDTTYLFENLLPATNYNFTVYALCDEGDTSMPASVSVRTPCGEWGPLPLIEDFNSYSSSSYPDCWTRIINSNNYPYITTDYNICLKSGGGASIITPRMPMPLNRLFVEFDLQREGSSSGNMEFGYTRDPNSVDSMVVVSSIYPGNTYEYYHYEFDFNGDTCTDSVYLVWHQTGTSNWYYWLDNLTITTSSSCPTVDLLRCNNHTNNMASIVWSDTSADHTEVMLYIATSNNMALAFDSVNVSAGTTNYVFTGLRGNTHYYVFAKALCSEEGSRVVMCDFTTDVDCAPVENLRVVATDYHAFGLNWDAPTAGESATEYVVSYRAAGSSAWISDTVSTLYYYVSGLDTNTEYQYRVSTLCDTLASSSVSGNVMTQGCSRMITAGGSTYAYLPTYIVYDYSYTQQIYLDAELGDGIDSISGISFYATSNISSRNVQIYLGNTNQSSFSSTSNYIPVDSLQLVYTGPLSGSGWINLMFDTVFVRQAGRNLVVATDDNTGSWVSSVPFGATSASNRSIYFYQDGTNINPASPSANSYALVNYVNQIKLTTPSCFIPSCNTPVVMVAGTGANQIDVVWYAEPDASYTVEYQREGTDVWVVADAANTTGACSVTGLLAGYNYTVRVSVDCDGLTLTGAVQTATICAPVALPYTEDFESSTGTFSRNCWYTGTANLGTAYPYPTVVNLTGDPNKLLLLYNGAYVILPEMDAPLNQLQIRFNFVQGGDNVRLVMGIMDDPLAPIATIRPIDTLIRSNIDTTSAYVYVTYPLDGISDTTGHLTFWDAFNDNYSFLDNIVVEYIPNCTSVQDVVATATASTATVSWTASGTSATSFLVEYGPRGFAAGTGTVQSATSSPATITGLAHSTSYDVYVYAVCAASGDTSIASQVAHFATECGAITALPYVQNFENIVEPGSTATNIVPNCWASKVLPAGASYQQPHVFYNTALTHAPSQQYCFYFQGIGIAALPEMGIPIDSLRISFHEWNSDPSTYGLIIGAVDNADTNFEASFQPIDTIPFSGTGNEFNVVSYLNGYTGTGTRIAIASYNTSGVAYADQYLDNLVIDRIPNCIAPRRVVTTLLTNVAADLAWTTSNAPNYSIEYGIHGFTPGTGTTLTSTSRNISITGLTPLTQYDVYLVSQCSATETSDTTFYTFTTLRAAPVTTLPYICTFADSAMAAAWELVNGTQANKWYVDSSTYYGTSDNRSLYISNDGGSSNSYTNTSVTFVYAYRTFNFNAANYSISYNWKANGESNYDYLRAWLAPANVEFTAGYLPDGTTYAYSYTSTTPTGWISLDGGSKQNLQNTWQTSMTDVTITTPGAYHLVFMWANDGSAGSNPPAAVDNVEVYLNTCPVPVNFHTTDVGSSYVEIDWTDVDSTSSWQIEYGPRGFSYGSGSIVNASTHPVTVNGLTAMTSYDFYVRPVCSGDDTGRWSLPLLVTTAMCDNVGIAENWDSTSTSTTTNYGPIGYSCYNYSYTQIIVDSAQLANLVGGITAFGFKPSNSAASYGSYYTGMDVYMANVSESTLSSGFIHPDSNHQFVQVLSNGNCNFTDDNWQTIALDSTFTWDGHSNLLVSFNRRHGSYSCSAVFEGHSATGSKMRYIYNDGSAYDINTVSGGTSTSTLGDLRLFSCGTSCQAPVVTSVTHDYHSATITWTGSSNEYEVNIKEATALDWPATDIPVTGNTYTFNSLLPETAYIFRVRQHCVEDSVYSNWVTDGFTTDDLPCFPPDNLTVSGLTNAEGTFAWTPVGNETQWDIHVWFTGGLDTVYRVNTNPATLGGYTAGITYNAAIRALCGDEMLEGEYGDTIQFTTATCPDVTGLSTSNVTDNSVTLNWTADPMAHGWLIEYGYRGFSQGTGTTVNTSTNSYTATGLEDETAYDFYVKAVCGEGWNSESWAHVSATTLEAQEPTYTITVQANDPSMGTVTGGGTFHGGETCTVTATPNTGYQFVNWSNGETANPYSFIVMSSMTLTANFARLDGIDGVDGNVSCTIYPNPTSTSATISVSGVSGEVRIAVVDMNGRTVRSETLECGGDCQKTMEVDGLAQGAYFVRITGETVNMVKKLVVR